MKRLLAFLALCLPIYLFAQSFGSFSSDQPYFAKDNGSSLLCSGNSPSSIPGLAFWWVASDLPAGGTVTNWVDRIQGASWTNSVSGNSPTNSSEGVYFSGSTWLTNSVDTMIATNALFCIIKRTVQSIDLQYFLVSRSTPNNGYLFSVFGGFGPFGIIANQPTAARITYDVKTNTWLSFVYSSRHGGAYECYTNGIFTFSDNVNNIGNYPLQILGAQVAAVDANNFKGYIREIAMWTNTFLSSANAGLLDCYSTNLYQYTP